MRLFLLTGASYADFDIKVDEPLLVASTKEKANLIKTSLNNFITKDCQEFADSIGREMIDLTIDFFLNHSSLKNKLTQELSCYIERYEVTKLIDELKEKRIYCDENVFFVNEIVYYE